MPQGRTYQTRSLVQINILLSYFIFLPPILYYNFQCDFIYYMNTFFTLSFFYFLHYLILYSFILLARLYLLLKKPCVRCNNTFSFIHLQVLFYKINSSIIMLKSKFYSQRDENVKEATRRRPFSYHTKMADFEQFRVLSVFS